MKSLIVLLLSVSLAAGLLMLQKMIHRDQDNGGLTRWQHTLMMALACVQLLLLLVNIGCVAAIFMRKNDGPYSKLAYLVFAGVCCYAVWLVGWESGRREGKNAGEGEEKGIRPISETTDDE